MGTMTGNFKGEDVTVHDSIGGHVFTKDEADRLFAGETITIGPITFVSGRTSDAVPVRLAYYEDRKTGEERLGVEYAFEKRPTHTGEYQGVEVSIPKEFNGHAISVDEASTLFAGGHVDVRDLKSKKTGKPYAARLEIGEYNGRPSLRMNLNVFIVPATFCGHTFTDDEIKAIEATMDGGEGVLVEGLTGKSGKEFSAILSVRDARPDDKHAKGGKVMDMEFPPRN